MTHGFQKGYIPWNKGIKYSHKKPMSIEGRKNLSNALKGRVAWNKGIDRPKGAKACHWKGGRRIHKGYVLIYAPDHPNKVMRFYIKEHRLVMENILGRYLEKDEVVHHINGEKTDNRPENLALYSNHSEHMRSHNHRRYKCYC